MYVHNEGDKPSALRQFCIGTAVALGFCALFALLSLAQSFILDAPFTECLAHARCGR